MAGRGAGGRGAGASPGNGAPAAVTSREALLHSCARFELRRRILLFGAEHLGWPAPDDVDDELYDAAEALADMALRYAADSLPEGPQ